MATRKRTTAGLTRSRPDLRTRPRAIAFAVGTALLPWTAHHAYADVAPNTLPTGANVVAGSASFSSAGSKLQITQGTNSAIVNYDTFSIGSNAWVNVTQPSSSAIMLSRVLGSNPSEIYGRLTANGQFWLTNPNGVLFAPSASVDVGALFATTLSIADKDFFAGRYNFYNAGRAGSVINQGQIITANGYAALAGPQVRNDGVIVAHAGTVALAAGDRVSLDMVGDGLIKVSVDQSALNASAINSGTITADGGNVILTARSANALLDTVVNNSGVIRANSLAQRNGEIILDGGSSGVASNTGTLTAAGVDGGTTGGTIKVLGQYVGLFDGSKIDASGNAGGGTVLVGGNFHGAGAEQNASRTYVDSHASINVNAVNNGSGGNVAVWSTNGTKFYGTITARGGAQSGDGGFVEVSGKNGLNFAGNVDAGAAHGAIGTLLLDPVDITITSDNVPANSTVTCAGGSATGTCSDFVGGPFTDSGTGTLTQGTLNGQLLTNTVLVIATNDITSNADVSIALAHTLTLTSTAGGINLGGTYDGTLGGGLNLNFKATLDLATNVPTFTSVTPMANGGGTGTIKASGETWNVAAPNSGSLGALGITFSSTPNLQETTSGTFNLNAGGSIGSIDGGTGSTLSYGSRATTVNVDLATGSGTDVTTFSNINNVVGSAAVNNTLINAGASWTINGADSGTSGGTSYSAFANLTDTGGGTFNIADGGSVTGNLSGGTGSALTYATRSGPVSFDLSGGAGNSTGVIGAVTGINNVTGSASTADTITGANQTYNLTALDAGNNGPTSWTSFENVSDTGTGTISASGQTVTINGANSGSHSLLRGSFSGIGNISDAGGGTFNMADGGSVTGNLSGGTGSALSYATRSGPVSFDLSGGAGNSTGVIGTVTGINNVTGSASTADTITGANQTYNLTALDAGNNGSTSWTSFENVSDTGTGTISASAQTATVTAANSGTHSLLTGSFSGIGNLADAGAGTFNIITGSLSGAVNGGTGSTLTYAGNAGPVSVDLATGAAASIKGGAASGFSGINNVVGSGNTGDTLTNAAATWTISGTDSGTSNATPYSAFANLADTGGGSFHVTTGSQSGTIAGGSGSTLSYAGDAGPVSVNLATGAAPSIKGGAAGGFSGINNVVGSNSTSDTLSNSAASWTISGANSGTSGTVTYSSFENLADAGGGTFDVTTGSQSGTLAGGTGSTLSYAGNAGPVSVNLSTSAGSSIFAGGAGGFSGINNVVGSGNTGDTLTNAAATWTVSGANSGTSGATPYSAFANLADTGGGTFHITTGSQSGTIAGGTGSTLTYAGDAGPVSVNLATGAATSIKGGGAGGFSGINNVVGSNSTSDTLSNSAATWTISGADSGTSGTVTYSSFENLSDAGNGTFHVTTGSVSGTIAGGTGSTLSYAGDAGPVSVNLATSAAPSIKGGAVGGFSGINNVVGSNSTSDTLSNSAASWTISGANSGTSGAVTYSSFENLADAGGGTFDVTTGSQSGTLAGGTGSTLSYAGNAGPVSVNLTTRAATGIFVGAAGGFSAINNVVGSGNTADTLSNAAATWTVSGANSGTSGATPYSAFANLSDTGGGTFHITSGSQSGTIAGGSGSTLTYTGDAGPVNVNLATGAATSIKGGAAGGFSGINNVVGSNSTSDTLSNSAASWTISGADSGTSATVTYSAFENLSDAGSGTFHVTTGSVSGTIAGGTGSTLSYAGDAGPVSVNLATASAPSIKGGAVGGFSGINNVVGSNSTSDTLSNSAASWTISGANTGTSGTVTYSSFENLSDAGGGTFDVTTGSQSGTLAGGTGSTLSYAGNTGPVTVNVSTASATGVKGGAAGGFNNINNFIGSSSTGDTLTGANRVWNISGPNSGTVSGTPWSAFENISDSSAGQFVGSGGSVSGSIIGGAGATTLSGIITSGASQTYNGAVTLSSTSTLNAGGSNVSFASTINGGGNSLTTNNIGTLSLGTGIANMASLTIQGGPSGGVSLPTTSLSANLDVTSSGAVTQTGALTVNGTSNVSAGGNAITLTNAGNNFGGAVSLSGGTTQIFDINALTLSALNTGSLTTTNSGALNLGSGTVNGTLNATTNNGSVTQSAGLTVTSNATINAGTGTITLASANDFQGSLTLTGATTQVTDVNALTLGTVNTGSLTAISSGVLNLGSGHVAGNLSATSNGANIGETGALVVDGASSLQAGAGGIGLTSANTFTGAVTASGGNIILIAANTLTPGTISAGGGNVTLIANGIATTGQLLGGSANLSSATDVGGSGSTLAINFGFGSVALSGTASAWNLSGPSVPQPLFTPNSQNTGPNVFYNNGCISGIACAGVFTVQASIGSSVSQIAAQAQKDAQSTDSVAKAIEYGGVEVGTAGAMQHQIEETGISTPDCLEESRDSQPCRN